MENHKPRKRISIVRWVISIIILIPILIIWLCFLTDHWRTFKVISRSMEPTLLVNDCLIMRENNDFPNLDNKVVVITDPKGGTFPLVKRVVAGPNSRVEISNTRVYIDSSDEPLPGEPMMRARNQTWSLKDDELFVLGDNRNNSEDSSVFGPINRSDVLGVITFRYWPFDRIGKVE